MVLDKLHGGFYFKELNIGANKRQSLSRISSRCFASSTGEFVGTPLPSLGHSPWYKPSVFAEQLTFQAAVYCLGADRTTSKQLFPCPVKPERAALQVSLSEQKPVF